MIKIMFNQNIRLHFIITLSSFLLLSSCSLFNETRFEKSLGRDVNLISYAYNIADDLTEEAYPPLIPYQPNMAILTTTFVDNNRLEKTSHFGRLLQDHIASRFVQQGYTVKEIKLKSDLSIEPGSGETMLSRHLDQIKPTQQAQAILVGTISMAQRTMYISARLVSPRTGAILSSRNYRLYMDRNVLAMFNLRPASETNSGIEPPTEPLINRLLY